MLDIEGITQKVNEIVNMDTTEVQLNESTNSRPYYQITWNQDLYQDFGDDTLDHEGIMELLDNVSDEIYAEGLERLEDLKSGEILTLKADESISDSDEWACKIKNISNITYNQFRLESDCKKLYNVLVKDGWFKEYIKYAGTDIGAEEELMDYCKDWVIDKSYELDKPYQDIEWVKINDNYYNMEYMWEDWKEYCQGLEKKKNELPSGEEFDECLNESIDKDEYADTDVTINDDYVYSKEDILKKLKEVIDIYDNNDSIRETVRKWDSEDVFNYNTPLTTIEFDNRSKFEDLVNELWDKIKELHMDEGNYNKYTDGEVNADATWDNVAEYSSYELCSRYANYSEVESFYDDILQVISNSIEKIKDTIGQEQSTLEWDGSEDTQPIQQIESGRILELKQGIQILTNLAEKINKHKEERNIDREEVLKDLFHTCDEVGYDTRSICDFEEDYESRFDDFRNEFEREAYESGDFDVRDEGELDYEATMDAISEESFYDLYANLSSTSDIDDMIEDFYDYLCIAYNKLTKHESDTELSGEEFNESLYEYYEMPTKEDIYRETIKRYNDSNAKSAILYSTAKLLRWYEETYNEFNNEIGKICLIVDDNRYVYDDIIDYCNSAWFLLIKNTPEVDRLNEIIASKIVKLCKNDMVHGDVSLDDLESDGSDFMESLNESFSNYKHTKTDIKVLKKILANAESDYVDMMTSREVIRDIIKTLLLNQCNEVYNELNRRIGKISLDENVEYSSLISYFNSKWFNVDEEYIDEVNNILSDDMIDTCREIYEELKHIDNRDIKPEEDGEEGWMEESRNLDIKGIKEKINEVLLMEMPARNYNTNFDVEPMIIYDDEDYDEDMDYSYNILSDYVDTKTKLPSWISNRDAMYIPELNKNIDEHLVCIVAIPGYYSGYTVGIKTISYDDYDIMREYFYYDELSEDSDRIYYKRYDDDADTQYTVEQAYAFIKQKINEEVKKAQQNLIEFADATGGRLYPENMRITQPETDGEEFNESLNESMLMEMPATNYTTFDIEPYILFDTEYGENEDGTIDEENYYNPIEDYIDRSRNSDTYIPSWINGQIHHQQIVRLLSLNEDLDNDVVYIIGFPGYYDGVSVGILARDFDEIKYELWSENVDDENGTTYYYYEGEGKDYIDKSKKYNEHEVEVLSNRILQEEIAKAKTKLIELQENIGGRLVPSNMAYTAPKTSGEEFNECKLDVNTIKKQIDEIVRMTDGNN